VYSARYAGEPKSDQRNNEKLIAALAGQANRRAHYYCVMVLVRYADDPEPLIAEGRWFGEIIDTPRGERGFGYDPYFLVPNSARPAPNSARTRRTPFRTAARPCANWPTS
jgi:XTP/dITP diphosphohydrolase